MSKHLPKNCPSENHKSFVEASFHEREKFQESGLNEETFSWCKDCITKQANSMEGTPFVFLGGTCNGSSWRVQVEKDLQIAFFNPMLPEGVEWTEEHQKLEVGLREEADIVLYYITPLMEGCYLVAEAVDDSNKRPKKTVFFIQAADFNKDKIMVQFTAHQLKALRKTGEMIASNGGFFTENYQQLINYLNNI